MTPQDPLFHDSDDINEMPSQHAPEDIQREIAAMLRDSARDDSATTRMPTSVEESIQAAIRAEMRDAKEIADGAPAHTMIPLPGMGRTRPQQASSHPGPSESETALHHSSPSSHSSTSGSAHEASEPQGASVHSLADRRSRRRGLARPALALGAAAAVAIGALGVWHSTNGSDSKPVAGSSPEVQVTQSNTAYTPANLKAQAVALETSTHPRITSTEQAKDQNLGDLSTKQGIQSCVKAIDTDLAGNPEKVYADFGTYRGAPAVIVVVVNHGTKNVWVVNRTCTKHSDSVDGPVSINT